jgi:hypothetical protein
MYSRETVGYQKLKKKHKLDDTLFEILEGCWNLKYFGVVLRNRDCRIKKL